MTKQIYLFIFILLACQTAVFGQASLQTRLDALLKQDFLKTSEVGITVYDLTADKHLYNYQDKKLYRPASVQKLITGITGLSVLGVNHKLETSLYYTGNIEGEVLNGDLYVVGGFDSEFAEEGLDSLVNIIDKSGIRYINGNLYGDVSMTDSIYWGRGWSWDDNPSSFQPYLSPLMLCKGCVEVTATPSQKDSLARLTYKPLSSYYTVSNQTKSRNPEAGKFTVSRNWLDNGNDIVVKGNVSSVRKEMVNIYTSRDLFMYVFRERLQLRGIMAPPYSFVEYSVDSLPGTFMGSYHHILSDALGPAMKESDNLSAEAIFYHLGARHSGKKRIGSKEGIEAIESFIDTLGFDHKNYRIADGSGVSLYNYVSPELVLTFLKYAYKNDSIYTPLYQSLPIAGVDGTLEYRMREGKAHRNVRAKTGTVTGVSSLAGYAKASNGHILAFVIMNQNLIKTSSARLFQNKVCEELCK